MADTSTFMSIASSIPDVDYGAIYRNAKLRRELEEERKLRYLNQFQQERGSFTPGMQDELQAEWDAIEADLDSGDMSFKAKARRQRMYNTYKDHAANALNYSTAINNIESTVLADPSAYNDPADILQQLQTARELNIPVIGFQQAIDELPKLASLRRYALTEISPNAAAGSILQNLKTSGGINRFYDTEESGEINPQAIQNSVGAWFNANALSQEEEDQAIAYVMHQQGALDGTMKDISSLKNLSDDARAQYIGQYAGYVTTALTNMLASDIETEKEKTQRDLNTYRTKARITAQENAAARSASTPDIFTAMIGDVQYSPPLTPNERGQIVKREEPNAVSAGMDVHALIEGTQPSYLAQDGTQYFIESIGINDDGREVAVVRFNQDVITGKADKDKHVARTLVFADEIPLTGLSNASQGEKIRETYKAMLPYWSRNFAGRQTQPVNQDGPGLTEQKIEQGISDIADLVSGLGPTQDVPLPPEGLPFNVQGTTTPRPTYFPELSYGDWIALGKRTGGHSNAITELVRQQYGRIASLTPQERIEARADIKKKLSEQFGIDIK